MNQDPRKQKESPSDHNPKELIETGEWIDDEVAAKRRDAVLNIMIHTAPKDQNAIRRNRKKSSGDDPENADPSS
jgi:hypothetical protein